MTPFLRHQSGQAFGRTLIARLNYGTIRVLSEPIGARRGTTLRCSTCGWTNIRVAGANQITAFVELFNMLNANAAQNINWETGASFLSPLIIVPPRIMRVGFRLSGDGYCGMRSFRRNAYARGSPRRPISGWLRYAAARRR